MPRLIKNPKQYAKLLLSVGNHGRGVIHKRPLNPFECGEMIQQIIDEEGEPLVRISERLDLGRPESGTSIYKKRDTTQVSLFLRLLNFSEKSKHFAGWGWEGYPKIPFSTMAIMHSLKPEEQDKIIQSSHRSPKKTSLVKSDVLKIMKWKNVNPDLPIDECIEKVLKLKPVVDTTHMVVCETHDKLAGFIKIHNNYRDRILGMLRESMDGKFYNLDATDILITISMDETAFKTFHDKQYKQNVPFTQFLNSFLEDRLD